MRVAFYKGTRPGYVGIYNRLVRGFERGKYSHCELVFSSGLSASASYMDGGIRFKQIEFDLTLWDFIDIPNIYEQEALNWFVVHEGKSYDIIGNIRFMFGWISDGSDKWFCSEAIAASLGIKDPFRYGPNVLFSTLQLIEESK